MSATHPPADVLVAFALGKLGEAEAAAVTAHLEECPACLEAANGVSSDSFVGGLAAAAQGPPPDLDPGTRPIDPDRDPPPPEPDEAGEPGQAGEVIAGRYKLVERVGEGGMGSVWVAHQTEPVKRKVAVKLIKAGMDSKAVLARFDAERQALAVMDHPNIAKVLDGGVHDGRPFFVMELVKGVPITRFCDERKLTPAQRLELFVPVCQAIQHAHQKGVIHRDVKPSNVLVALYDDKPIPKVIDFGVAKAAGAALTEHTLETGFGAVVGTPAYMSPEQASLNNLDVDTRSDVYALGVLLYELLTGGPPFPHNELKKKGVLEMLRVVREEEPPKPSVRLSTAETLPSIAAARGVEPGRLTGLLRSELDWVVMKALEKDRARRYTSANEFAADVQRYLTGEPVQAHPPTAGYRLKKFVRRHRGPMIAAAVVAVVVVLGVIGSLIGLTMALAAERKARVAQTAQLTAERNEAQERESRLREGLEGSARLALVRGDVRKMLAVLDDMERRGLAFSPELRLERAAAYQTLGDQAGADRELDSLATTELSSAQRGRAAMLRADGYVLTDFDKADEFFREAERWDLPEADREYLRGLRAEGSPAALAAFRTALASDPRHLPARRMATLTAYLLGHLEEAVTLAGEARLIASDHPDVIFLSGLTAAATGRKADADAFFARAKGPANQHPLLALGVVQQVVSSMGDLKGDGKAGGDLGKLFALQQTLLPELKRVEPAQFERLKGTHLPPPVRPQVRILFKYALPGDPFALPLDNPVKWMVGWAKLVQQAGERKWTAAELAEFKRDLVLHPEGALTLIYANALFEWANGLRQGVEPTRAENIRAFREAGETFIAVARATAGVVSPREVALDLAVAAYSKAAAYAERPEEGKSDFDKAGELAVERFRRFGRPSDPARLQMHSNALRLSGRYDLARYYLAEWERVDPAQPRVWLRQAQLAKMAGDPLIARRAAAAALGPGLATLPDGAEELLKGILDQANSELMKLGAREMLPPPRPAK